MLNAAALAIGSPKEAERTVRLLLHRARKPDELARFPLAIVLCTIYNCDEPAIALRRAVEEALPSHQYGTLRTLILECDIEGTQSLREACERFAYSRRHFQRFRARAVGTIAQHVRALVMARAPGGEAFALSA